MSKLRFALIGCGRIGERHARHISHFGELVAVCDIEPSRAQQFADVYKVPFFTDYIEMLRSQPADVAVICTPNGLHATQSIEALHHGKHVLVEKPMAIKTQDCIAMMDAAEKNNRKLFVVKQNRYNAPVVALKRAIEAGNLGRIFSIQINCYWNRPAKYYADGWRGTLDLDGGTLFTQFSHFIDLIYWLFGDVKQVKSIVANQAHEGHIEFEDCGVVNMVLENNVLAGLHYSVNTFSKNMEGSVTVIAEKGTVKIGGQYLNTLEYVDADFQFDASDMKQEPSAPNDYGFYQGSMSNHDKVYAHLIDCFSSGNDFLTNAFEAYKAVDIIEKIYSSSKVPVCSPQL